MYWSRDENGFVVDAAKPFVSYVKLKVNLETKKYIEEVGKVPSHF